MSTSVSVGEGVCAGVGLGVRVDACVRDCFERAWATPDFGYQTWLKHCFGKAWATPDIGAETCTPKLINDCFEKAWATPDFAYQTWFKHCCGKAWATPDTVYFNGHLV